MAVAGHLSLFIGQQLAEVAHHILSLLASSGLKQPSEQPLGVDEGEGRRKGKIF